MRSGMKSPFIGGVRPLVEKNDYLSNSSQKSGTCTNFPNPSVKFANVLDYYLKHMLGITILNMHGLQQHATAGTENLEK